MEPSDNGSGPCSCSAPTLTITAPRAEVLAFVAALERDWIPYNARGFFNRLVEATAHAEPEPAPPDDSPP